MTAPASSSFPDQLVAFKRARLALSAARRSSSPVTWWTGAAIKLGASLALIAVSGFTGVIVASRMSEGGEEWTEVGYLVLYLPVMLWGWLLLTMLGADPLAKALTFAGASRRRASWLLVIDGVCSKATLLMLAVGLAPWIALRAAGYPLLSPAGWLGVSLMLVAMCSWRQLMRALYVTAAIAGGRRRGVAAVAMFLFGGASLVTSERSLRFLSGEARGTDITGTLGSLPAAGAFAAVSALSLILAAALYSARVHRLDAITERLIGLAGTVAPQRLSSGPVFHPSPVIAGVLLQSTRVLRDPAAWIATAWLIVARVSEIFTGTGSSIEFVAFVAATGGFYNLYGDQAPHYTAWLTSGRSLGTWTLSLVIVQLFRCSVVLVLGVTVLVAPPWADGARAEAFAWSFLMASTAGALAGPFISRRWPVPTRAHSGPVHLGAPVFISWAGSFLVGAAFLSTYRALGGAVVLWALPAALLVAAYLLWRGPLARTRWTGTRRARFHAAFAHHARS